MNKYTKAQYLSIAEQITEAFNTKPTADGVIHGLRKIILGTVGKRPTLFPSKKNGGMIALESRLEFAYALQLERDPEVKAYRTQALKIAISKAQFVYPDFLIKYQDETIEVHEVKPDSLSINQVDFVRYNLLKLILKNSNIDFRFVDRSELPTEYESLILNFLYQNAHTNDWSEHQILSGTRSIPPLNDLLLMEVQDYLTVSGLPKELANYLIFYGHISLPSLFATNLRNFRGKI
jgi:hypothetical protein